MKLWYGESHHQNAYEQLAKYLKTKNHDCGYLLTFDFRKETDENYSECKWIEHDGKKIFDVVVRVGGKKTKN